MKYKKTRFPKTGLFVDNFSCNNGMGSYTKNKGLRDHYLSIIKKLFFRKRLHRN